MPQPTDNGLTYTFKLKPNLKFAPRQPGHHLQGHRLRLPANQRRPLGRPDGFYYFGIIKGIDGQAKTAATKISSIDTPDDRTITFRLTNPAGDFLNRLAMPATGPSPRRSRSATPWPGTTAAT